MPDKELKNILKKIKLNEKTISQTLGTLVVVVIGVLIFNYLSGIDKGEVLPKSTSDELAQEAGEVKLVEEEGKIVPDGLPTEYTIQKGEDLWKIAEKFYNSGYNWVDIAKANNITNPNLIEVNQNITIPKVEIKQATATDVVTAEAIADEIYEVKEGDSLWKIALRSYGDGYQWTKIAKANNLDNPNFIHTGNNLTIPR